MKYELEYSGINSYKTKYTPYHKIISDLYKNNHLIVMRLFISILKKDKDISKIELRTY